LQFVRIVFATSEATPLAKTGGLADVSRALPVELARLGQAVCVILPGYPSALASGAAVRDLQQPLSINIGAKMVSGRLLETRFPDVTDVDVPVYLVQQDDYYHRPGLYQEGGRDYIDNCERFVFFCRAVMEAVRMLELRPDVLHCNDWQTGLIPAYLKTQYAALPGYEQTVCVFTVHNLAYQGQFWHWDMLLTGLDWKYFNWQQMEFYGNLNLLKTGLVFADALTTVSPRYAQEIQTESQGCGLEGVLRQRSSVLRGILNGVDYSEWDPSHDPHLPARYGVDDLSGKSYCKAALQQELGLPQRPDVPLVGFIGRLAEQKGLDLITAVLPQWAEATDVQWVFLGTGEPQYEEGLQKARHHYPHKVGVHLGFSNPLAHRIEAGADMFLMPSRFEPCGLNQLYSLKYGTVPVVRATGGLADTIVDASEANLAAGTANGFSFVPYTAAALNQALQRACSLFAHPEAWRRLQRTGMLQDWSWQRSAREYLKLYEETLARARSPART
jgi:starch synthase